MTNSRLNFLSDLRRKLSAENEKIINHRFVRDALNGKHSLSKFRRFATQQHYILYYDLRSLATMLSRTRSTAESEFFQTLIVGEKRAFDALLAFSEEIGLGKESLATSEIAAGAVAYAHYMCWLANYANPGEQATALTMNLSVWGNNCQRLASALRNKYHLKRTIFFELFSGPFDTLERNASKIIDKYVDEYRFSMERCARLIQNYELMFWNSL